MDELTSEQEEAVAASVKSHPALREDHCRGFSRRERSPCHS
jgi:hypothetical protein